jgi:hypothetical protein
VLKRAFPKKTEEGFFDYSNLNGKQASQLDTVPFGQQPRSNALAGLLLSGHSFDRPLTIMGHKPIINFLMRPSEEKASVVLHQKLALRSGLLSERKIWRVGSTDRYPLGIKYRLALVNPKAHEVILLYDNHWPKGPHVHWGAKERSYEFVSVETLLKDFIQESEVEERRYYENKENRD